MSQGSWGTSQNPKHIVIDGNKSIESYYATWLPSNDSHYTKYTNLRNLFQKALTELESKNIEMDALVLSRHEATKTAINARHDFFNLIHSIQHSKKNEAERREVPMSSAGKENPLSHREDARPASAQESASASAPAPESASAPASASEQKDIGGSRTKRTRRTRRTRRSRRSRRSIKTRRTRRSLR